MIDRGFGVVCACVLLVGVACESPGDGGDCTDGAERCACYGNGTCDDGLTCASDICVKLGEGGAGGDGGSSGAGGGGGSVTVEPVDIIFVVDNSGSMVDEIAELRDNLGAFFTTLGESNNDYRVGFITPDIACNVPERQCPSTPGGTAPACCNRVALNGLPDCLQGDDTGDGFLDYSNCDGGRFRGDDPYNRVFDRPEATAFDPWFESVTATINSLGCDGSGYEAGLESVRRAVVCSLSEEQRALRGLREVDDNGTPADPLDDVIISDACPDQNVAELNAGFLRDDADLVIIFFTDEDDCSFYDSTTEYLSLTNNIDAVEQAAKLCSPTECYAYHGAHLDNGGTIGLMDWADRNFDPRLDCPGNVKRFVNPPFPTDVAGFLDDIIAAKGDVAKVRAGGIISGVRDAGAEIGFAAGPCFYDATRAPAPGPSSACGCWATGTSMYCDITSETGGDLAVFPIGVGFQDCDGAPLTADGCQAMTGNRYVSFLELLAQRRVAAAEATDVYADSICELGYADAMDQIVQTVFVAPGG